MPSSSLVGKKALKDIIKTFINTENTLANVHCNGILITATKGHPFFTKDESWIAALEGYKGKLFNKIGVGMDIEDVQY